MVGIDPHPFTLRELCLMHDAKCETDWNHTASLMALLANINRDPKRRTAPFGVSDFHPMMQRVSANPTPADITSLKNVFLRGA